MAKFRREFKNVVYNYTDAEVKVRDATSNDPWGPSGSVMSEIAEYTFHVQAYSLVMGMLWKRLNDHGKNWRHVYKALVVLEYLIKNGSERVVQQCKDNLFSIETLKDFQFIDKDGKDNGNLVREKAKNLVELLKDDQKLTDERSRASVTRERNTSASGFGSASNTRKPQNTSTPDRSNHPSSVTDDSSPSAVFQPHIDQSRPSAHDEEDLQLQLALRMSKEQAEEEEKLRQQEEESLKIALEMSKNETSTQDEEDEEEADTSNTGDLIGLGDPWAATTNSTELPPSYDIVIKPVVDDTWTSTQQTNTVADPFTTDPFAIPTIDPFVSTALSSGANNFESDTFTSGTTTTWTSFSPTTTTVSDPFDNLPATSIAAFGSNAPQPVTFDMSALSAPLNSISVSSDKKPTVEESFLGDNATLVNLDTLIAPLPPPTSINPFGVTPMTIPTTQSTNPFEANKPPAPTLAELQQGNTFDPLPPPLLPVGTTGTKSDPFNPFS